MNYLWLFFLKVRRIIGVCFFQLGDASPLYHRGMVERSFTLRVIEPSDTPEVINFLNRFFFRDEPLNIETGMDLDYINGKCAEETELSICQLNRVLLKVKRVLNWRATARTPFRRAIL